MSREKTQKITCSDTAWDFAINEAEKQLKQWRSKVARLMASLDTFKEAKRNGEPWPGSKKKAGTAKEAIPA